jgi:hypothetical protein
MTAWMQITLPNWSSSLRFMESRLSFFRMHWDHEPDRAYATSAASRSVTAEHYDVPGFGLLVGKIGSG